MDQMKDSDAVLDKEDLNQQLDIIWSSGKILEYNIQSQLSQMMIQAKQLELIYEEIDRPTLISLVKEVSAPFKQ